MASVEARPNKAGGISYRFRVYVGETTDGHQKMKSKTWTPPKTMSDSAALKEAKKQSVLYENSLKQGTVSLDGKVKFGEYCRQWLQVAQIAPKTREHYEYLLQRVDDALGHIRLDKLQGHHIEAFYQNLRESNIKRGGGIATPTRFSQVFKESGFSQTKLAAEAGVAWESVKKVCDGKAVTYSVAQKLCKTLHVKPEQLFSIEDTQLSEETLMHYHRFIRSVLTKAKRDRLVVFNVAAEHVTPPKTPRREIVYLDDVQAAAFYAALQHEPDIRVKTALLLAISTGARKGELCGLSWADIDFDNATININKASQYQRKKGVVEVQTKTASSVRTVDVFPDIVDALRQYRIWWMEHKLMHGEAWQGDELQRLLIQDDGKPIHPDTINYWLDKFTAKNGLPRITPHSLRHTFTTLQIIAGIDIRTIQSRTGHAQASTVANIYSHAVRSAQEKASKALESILLSASNV